MDKETKHKRKLQRVRNFFLTAVICYVCACLILNYLLLLMGALGDNVNNSTQVTSSSSQTTVENVDSANSKTDLSFKLKYLYIPPESFDIKLIIVMSIGLTFFICKRLDDMWLIKNGNKGLKGDVHWATEKDLQNNKDFYCIADENHLERAEKSGLIVAKYGNKLYCDTSTSNSMIIGTTRSGKGQTFVLPKIRAIAMSKSKHSLVINDPKGEICEYTFPILKENGYEVVILNLADTNYSSLWNPLEVIKEEYVKAMRSDSDLSQTTDMVNSLASLFTDNPKSDPIWPESAKSLLVAMILYLLEDGYKKDSRRSDGKTPNLDKLSLYSVYQFFIAFGTVNRVQVIGGAKRNVNALDELFQKLPIGNPARSSYATSNFSSGEMRSSIFATLSSNLQIFGSDEGIQRLTSGNQINFGNLIVPNKPCAIFMIVPDEKPSRHVIASLFIHQCYEQLVAQSRNFPDNKLPQRVIFELDEFGNMVRIPSMDNKITVSAGRNILWTLYCQDLNQLDTKYDTQAKTIRSNCANVVYIQSIDRDTNEYFSALLGNETVEYRTYSGSLREWLNHQNINIDSRPLMSGEQLSRLEEGTAITKRMRCYPIKTKLDYFYKLGIKPVPIKNIPIELIKIDLEKVRYNFAPIGRTIHLMLRNGVFEDVTPTAESSTGSQNGKLDSSSYISAVSKVEADKSTSEILTKEKGVPSSEATKPEKWTPPQPPQLSFVQIPAPATESISPTAPTEDENRIIGKLDMFTDSEFSKACARFDVSTAQRLATRELKIKRHITPEEHNIIQAYLDRLN